MILRYISIKITPNGTPDQSCTVTVEKFGVVAPPGYDANPAFHHE